MEAPSSTPDTHPHSIRWPITGFPSTRGRTPPIHQFLFVRLKENELQNSVREQTTSAVESLLGPLYTVKEPTMIAAENNSKVSRGRGIFNSPVDSPAFRAFTTRTIFFANIELLSSQTSYSIDWETVRRHINYLQGNYNVCNVALESGTDRFVFGDSQQTEGEVYSEIPDTPPPPAPPSIANRIPLQHIRCIGQAAQSSVTDVVSQAQHSSSVRRSFCS